MIQWTAACYNLHSNYSCFSFFKISFVYFRIEPTSGVIKLKKSILLEITPITHSLYMSAARAVQLRRLNKLGITCLINVASELPNLHFPKIDYMKINIDDMSCENIYPYFHTVGDKIEETRRRGGRTLVYCVGGISRSATFCLAYLMEYKKMSLREAYTLLKSRRYVSSPNRGFFRQLIDYEKKLFGRESVYMGGRTPGRRK